MLSHKICLLYSAYHGTHHSIRLMAGVKDFPSVPSLRKGQTIALNINRNLDNDKAILADDINGWGHKHCFVYYKIQTY